MTKDLSFTSTAYLSAANLTDEEEQGQKQKKPLLPPGVKFYPSPFEVVNFFLPRKVLGQPLPAYSEFHEGINFYGLDPDHLPIHQESLDERWAFFILLRSPEERIRHTPGGYWQGIKKVDAPIKHEGTGQVIGFKKTFTFYEGKAPLARKTRWNMQEYRLKQDTSVLGNHAGPKMKSLVACKVYMKKNFEGLENIWREMYNNTSASIGRSKTTKKRRKKTDSREKEREASTSNYTKWLR